MDDSTNGNIIVTRAEKLKYLELDKKTTKKDISDKILEELYQNKIKKHAEEKGKLPTNIRIKKSQYTKLDKTNEKYILTLKFLNDLLKAIGKEEIDDITNFKEVRRDDLLTDSCQKVFDNHISEICKVFGKSQIYYRNKDSVDNYLISLIKYMIKLIGYQFVFKTKINKKPLGDNVYNITSNVLYSIKI